MTLALSFTLACRNGHGIEVDETEGQRLNGTACQTCFKPLLVQRLLIAGEAAPAPVRRCRQHNNGDPCCWRQNGWSRFKPEPRAR